jgi:uncharacterized protein YpmB
MTKQSMLRLSVIILATAGAISTASAQTSAQAENQNTQAQSAAVTQLADAQQAGLGEAHGATTGSTHAVAHVLNGQSNRDETARPCVGPVSFCTLYFGS